ncbi:MAG: hypothetical protein LBC51_04410, partial [Treponema sp.]|nr:hypothetical protein [Treponema sp.]
MERMTVFINACRAIAQAFAEDGFTLKRGGISLIKRAEDTDMVYDVSFGPLKQFRKEPYPAAPVIYPCFTIRSGRLRQWLRAQTHSPYHSGQLYSAPRRLFKEWEWSLAGERYARSITGMIQDTRSLIAYLQARGRPFYPELGKDAAERFLKACAEYGENTESPEGDTLEHRMPGLSCEPARGEPQDLPGASPGAKAKLAPYLPLPCFRTHLSPERFLTETNKGANTEYPANGRPLSGRRVKGKREKEQKSG